MYETGAPPPPPPLPDARELVLPPAENAVPAPATGARPARGYDATSVIGLGGPPPGTVTYRLRGTETSAD